MIDCLFLGMENADYSEWVPTGALVKSLFVGFSAYIVIFTLAFFLFVELSVEIVYGLIFAWGILAVVLFSFWNYRGIKIQISNDKLLVVYGFFNRKTFLLKDIVSCKITLIIVSIMHISYSLDFPQKHGNT